MNRPDEGTENEWDTTDYDEGHSFVFEYGEGVVDLLEPKTGERVLDLGCGTGHLADRIASSGADVVGLDSSAEMISEARESYPECRFVHGDARDFSFSEPFDAVFSNAALHWVSEQDAVLDSITDTLRPDGRFVAELGGTGNVATILDAVRDVATDRGYDIENPWYFPSVGEYTTNLEAHGFEVRYATLFDRPTELDGGPDGLSSWLEMFGDGLLAPVPDDEQRAVVSAVEDRLRDDLFEDGTWTADYRRLRVVAVNKPE
ncbi:methyltransferase domain-containing protein [Haladaptatus sp. AB618]|uniref:class I SAM-dependent methyltransferase n=1 Tax=Haladaptatus sp. AB618 TaxID=2934173 RepID=UPI00209C1B06|nr:class I SAM-dependent methyltransferase [Haladaptatus sp. AB618]MCO8252220.1 methyltransferase domain-containing protein [Haladaptatus sp. AB618]